MKYGEIIIEKKEYSLLKDIMSSRKYYQDKTYKSSIDKLQRELKNARILPLKEVPDDVVRFNSIVTIKTPSNLEKDYQLVKPEQSDIKNGKISVLAPMGLALLGYAAGDKIEWEFPGGVNTIEILDVKQPQASVKPD